MNICNKKVHNFNEKRPYVLIYILIKNSFYHCLNFLRIFIWLENCAVFQPFSFFCVNKTEEWMNYSTNKVIYFLKHCVKFLTVLLSSINIQDRQIWNLLLSKCRRDVPIHTKIVHTMKNKHFDWLIESNLKYSYIHQLKNIKKGFVKSLFLNSVIEMKSLNGLSFYTIRRT